MASGPRLVILNPPKELEFDLKRQDSSEQKLTITNVHDGAISFKVKTTAPKAYLVRPSNDVLKKGQSVDIQILLQPSVGRDAPHRFLVQAVALPPGKTENLSKSEWTSMSKDQIHEQRLSVIEPRGGSSGGGAGETVEGLPAHLIATDPNNLQDLQKKYDELVKYVLNLETQTQQLEAQRDDLRVRASRMGKAGGYTLFHMILAMVVVVGFSKLPMLLGQK